MIYRTCFLILFAAAMITHACKKSNSTDCSCKQITTADDAFDYRMIPGSTEWNAAGAAGGIDSLYVLCQVPDTILASMSTLGLIQTLESNPMLLNMMLRDDKFSGRDEVLTRLNANQELITRSDAPAQLIDYYSQKEPCCVTNMIEPLAKGKFANDWYFFDMISTQDTLMVRMDDRQKKSFARVVIEKFNQQLMFPETFGSTKTSSALILSNLMKSASYQPYFDALAADMELDVFSRTGILTSSRLLTEIISQAKAFII